MYTGDIRSNTDDTPQNLQSLLFLLFTFSNKNMSMRRHLTFTTNSGIHRQNPFLQFSSCVYTSEL